MANGFDGRIGGQVAVSMHYQSRKRDMPLPLARTPGDAAWRSCVCIGVCHGRVKVHGACHCSSELQRETRDPFSSCLGPLATPKLLVLVPHLVCKPSNVPTLFASQDHRNG